MARINKEKLLKINVHRYLDNNHHSPEVFHYFALPWFRIKAACLALWYNHTETGQDDLCLHHFAKTLMMDNIVIDYCYDKLSPQKANRVMHNYLEYKGRQVKKAQALEKSSKHQLVI